MELQDGSMTFGWESSILPFQNRMIISKYIRRILTWSRLIVHFTDFLLGDLTLWAHETPDDFVFTAKLPRRITSEKRLTDYKRDLEYLYEVFRPLQKKLAVFLIQLPPSFTFAEGMGKLSGFLKDLDYTYRYAIEFRHDSWFRNETCDLLTTNNVSLAWSELPAVTNPGILTSDFIYLRFKGERDLPESSLGEIRRDLQDKKQV